MRPLLAEVVGTFLLVLFGTGAVAAAVLTGAQVGLWQVAVVWGFGVTLAIFVAAPLSGAHLNPAISLAFALLRPHEFAPRRLVGYVVAQTIGAIAAGIAIAALFGSVLARFESQKGLTRGGPGSEWSAMVFGQYFPNPAIFGTGPDARALVTPLQAFGVEAFGTAILALVVFALTDRRVERAGAHLTPALIGFTVASLISLFAPLTQAGWNPARDFGPRLVALALGWGSIAIPGPESGFWIYIAGPLVGAPLGALLYERVLAPRGAHS